MSGLALVLLLSLAGCRAPATRPAPKAIEREASAAFEHARERWRRGGELTLEEARSSASRAVELDPGWVAPRRFLDELSRADLLAVDALALHRRELLAHPEDAGRCYLAGRLEGRSGGWRFERAVRVAPQLAWGWHGMAWSAANDGDAQNALRYGEKALSLARDPFEEAYFQSALARIDLVRGKPRDALARLLPLLEAERFAAVDRLELSVLAAQIELSMFFQPEGRRGEQRALALLRNGELTEPEVEILVARLRFLRVGDSSAPLDLQLALAARSTPARDRLRAELMLEERPTPLALGLLARSRESQYGRQASGPLLRAARFAAGQFELGVEEWLADLPQVVLDEQGLPRDVQLAALVDAARALGDSAPRPAAGESEVDSRLAARWLSGFGDSLIAAGWFREARAVAGALAAHDLDQALALEDRSAGGQQLLSAARRLFTSADPALFAAASAAFDLPARFRPMESGPIAERHSAHVDGMLEALAQLFARSRVLSGQAWQPEQTTAEFRSSPRYKFGWFGELVHPGPFFSERDEQQGLGQAGAAVPGMAAAFAGIGRFALLGEVLGGGGPDATVLQRALVERRSGKHLGVPWSGTVAWCEGADVRPRAAREGATISGAALHEGYWIDIDAVRRERDVWARLQSEFGGPLRKSRRLAALSTRGLPIVAPADRPDLARLERRSVQSLLGESDRMRLAVLAEREGLPGRAASVRLDELVELTAIHEEGHLCDRGRMLPLSSHWLRAMGLVARAGFTPQGIAERLEYRAQLVALCEAPDPRMAWVDVLSAGESETQGLTPHAGAYRRLLVDLIDVLDRQSEQRPTDFPGLDRGFVLAHQLHALAPDSLRRVAIALAKREGLTKD